MDDAGNYICEVENEAEPIKQTNTLQILGEFIKCYFLQWNELKIINRALPCGLISNILVHSEVRAVFELRGDPMEMLQVELSTNPSHVSTIKDKTLLECSNDNEAFI